MPSTESQPDKSENKTSAQRKNRVYDKTPTAGSSPDWVSAEDLRQDRERQLFDSLRMDDQDTLPLQALFDALLRVGLRSDDPRLADSRERADEIANGRTEDCRVSYQEFQKIVRPNSVVIERALRGNFVIPEFELFCEGIDRIYQKTTLDRSGAVADYIPQLARVDPDQYGVALCTIDGQRYALGDATVEFCVQSCCKPINYCIALEDQGEQKVHQHIGREPSGHGFNELTLNKDGRPHNPMINSGAIMACSLIRPDFTSADRFDHVVDVWRRLSGGKKPGFSNPTYLSERGTADRNFALGYFMREQKAFPENSNLTETLEFYFQCCSIEMTTESMSMVAATLANGGICPTTGDRVFSPDSVQKCLSLMYSCGMYDFSGEWGFSIGLPGKSGVAGAVLVVIPNVMGLCTWSPRLDCIGNSVRGVSFFRELVGSYNFHNYDNLTDGVHHKTDPRLPALHRKTEAITDLCWAANEGDLTAVRRLVARGVNLDEGDYDGRTALHLAVCGGHTEVVEYFIARKSDLSPKDRWGGTPLDDALREGHQRLAEVLEHHGATRG